MAKRQNKFSSGSDKDPVARVLAFLERRWLRESERRDAMLRPGDKTVPQRILVLHGGSEKQAADLAQILGDAGYPNTSPFHLASPLVTEAMLNGADAVVFWYDEKQTAAIRAMEHLLEYRDRVLPRLLVVYPGEKALNALVKSHSHLFFDMLLEFSRGRDRFRTALKKLFAKDNLNEESATHILRRIRAPGLTLRNAESLAAKLRTKPGKAYWARAEFIPHLIKAQDYPRAMDEALALRHDFKQAFDPILWEHTVRRARSSKEFDGERFVADVMQSPVLSLPRVYAVARRLYLWRRPDALRSLLDFWHGQSHLPSDAHYHHAEATYYRMVGMPQMELDHILLAIEAQPLTALFLEVGATALADQDQFLPANAFLKYAIRAQTLDNRRLTLTLATNMVKGGQAEQAAKLLEKLIRDNPDYEPGRRVYRRLFSSLLDVS